MRKLSARNQLKGKVVEVKKGQTTAHVRIAYRRRGHCHLVHHQ
jgi:molybdopterin-binding protein